MHAEKITPFVGKAHVDVEYGTIQGGKDDHFAIQSQAGLFVATRAFSCIVQPQAGDRVMYSRDDKQQCYILAIIERPVETQTTLAFDGDVCMQSRNGKVSLAAKQGIDLASSEKLTMVAEEVDLVSKKGVFNIESVTSVGEHFNSNIKRVKMFAHSIDTVADRVSQHLKNSFRLIEGVDQTKAGEILTTVKNLFSLRSRQAAVLAKQDVKIDGERIHMG